GMNAERRDRPILFKDDMIRAILEGRKTQTRRIAKNVFFDSKFRSKWKAVHKHTEVAIDTPPAMLGDVCPYGQLGDRLWVREKFATHFIWDGLPPGHIDIQNHSDGFFYADGTITSPGCEDHQRGKWRPSIHMPRWASRITLEITGIRVERLQDISEADAKAEGVLGEKEASAAGLTWYDKPRRAFRFLWESISGPGSWDE